jgi:hypothetical protein
MLQEGTERKEITQDIVEAMSQIPSFSRPARIPMT